MRLVIGTYDWQCNWLGNEKWTVDLEWSGHDDFAAQPLRDWYVEKDGKAAGKTRSTKGFTFATVFGAGHLVRFGMIVCFLEYANLSRLC